MSDYVKAFVIGSSYPVFIPFFYAVSQYDESMINYGYKSYTLIAPLFLGTLNVVGLYLANTYGLSRMKRFGLTGTLGALTVATTITVFKAYNFSTARWIQQYVSLIIVYIFVFCVIVNVLDMYI
jgi:hypothetical protein